ncbi:glycosyltransferase family 2 protein [Myxacorys almedinensis]|uniref:Glycosyltransferase n=1 Tax=Myxacorys almedinensis A TaxID=2690445 RepID=A0A8J7Z405_9CYAN|nr:glycosyltransferase [Myxacorys almedinensis]NDJ16063.1 glycosyltransferase [Myxacorys almedinensis A]
MSNIGIVVIGRNEGARLVRCLKSIINQVSDDTPIVYVDSGSTDGSVAFAKSINVHVINLDMSIPFTMARGRNTGLSFLTQHFSTLNYVQFIDGDCELIEGWLDRASQVLSRCGNLAVVCGRLHERFPEASVYNRLADMEWNTPVGEADFCGGIAMMRISALKEIDGYNTALICGEEPEMCIRLRRRGWKIRRIAADMAIHDMAMTRFGQWWKRSIRGGWAVAEGAAMYGRSPERYMVRENMSGWLWGIAVPIAAISLAWLTCGLSVTLLVGYPYLILRVYQYRQSQGDHRDHAWLYASFCVLSKIPQAIGQLRYWFVRWQGQPATIIEYKSPVLENVDDRKFLDQSSVALS